MQATTWRDFEGKTVDGKYYLQRLIGTGSFGAVYVADEVVADRLIRQVAVKLIEPEAADTDAQFAELIAAANLDHPALLRCIAPGQAEIEGRLLLSLVTELAQESLADRLQSGPLPPTEVQRLAEQLGGALAYLHSRPRPLIHRDVKPGNVLRVGGNWKLGDFGLLRAMPETGTAQAETARVGTPAYAPPESYEGGLSPAWDVWSFGILVYESLLGRFPFAATTPQQFRIAVASQEPNFPDSLPPPFDTLLRGCLRRDPVQRWSIAQALEALDASALPALRSSPDLAAGFYARLDVGTPLSTALETTQVTVSLDRSGDYDSIGEAIRSVSAGTKILIRPGMYHETLLLDREVEIVADGVPGCVVVEAKGAACLVVRGGNPILRGLALHSRARVDGRRHYAVEILGGEPLLEDCDLLCNSQAVVSVQGATARPLLRRCRLHDGKTGGIVFADHAGGTLEACEIDANAGPGIVVRAAADPVVRNCRIHSGRDAGVVITEGGRGVFEECDIYGNVGPNVQIGDNATPLFRRIRIHDGQQAGVTVRGAQGIFEDCDIFANGLTGVTLTQQANPVFRRCTLRDGHANGLAVSDGAQGLLEDCAISGNAFAGIKVAKGGSPILVRTSLFGGKRAGILVQAQGRATLTECDLHTNQQANAQVESHGVLLLRQCLLHDSTEVGTLVAGEARLEGCEIYANARAGLEVPAGGSVILRSCRVHHGNYPGLLVQDGEALMEDCDLYANAMSNAAVGERGRLDMRRCTLRDSRQYGLLFWDGATGRAEECTLSGNTLGGVRLNASAHPLLQSCRINKNGGFGLHASHQADATFAHCDLRDNLLGPVQIDPPCRIVNTESLV